MAVASILKIAYLAITHWPIVRFQQNYVRGSRTACRQGLADKNCKFFKSKMADGRHFENRFFGHKSSTDCPISTKFCMRKQNSMLTRTTGQKMQMCKIQDSRRPPFWKSLNCHLSVKNCLILMKFDTLHQILNPVTVTSPKLKFLEFKMTAAAILKFAFLAITRPIVRFRRNFVCGSITACRQRPHDKNCKFSKSKTVDGRHFENR